MRIAQVSPLAECVPPRTYGGTERIVSYLTEALIGLGHDVTLFAAGGSRTSASLRVCSESALRDSPSCYEPIASHLLMMRRVLKEAASFDIIHFHTDLVQFPIFAHRPAACLTTLHGRLDRPELRRFFDAFDEMPLVAISAAQRASLPEASWIGTVHHGLPEAMLRPGGGDGGYLAFLGRVSPEKGLARAIRIARRAGMPLRVAAKIDRADTEFFNTVIRPELGPDIAFLGEIDDSAKEEFLGRAAALLFPIEWPEPFGLVMIEAMACGTPVIAFPNGAAPEVIEDGITGFLVAGENEAAAALRRLADFDRSRIRQRFEERFSARRMAMDYVGLYERLLAGAVAIPDDRLGGEAADEMQRA